VEREQKIVLCRQAGGKKENQEEKRKSESTPLKEGHNIVLCK
jgi:hypothetical protein